MTPGVSDRLASVLSGIVGARSILLGDQVRQRSAGFIRPGESLLAAALVQPRSTLEVAAVMAACNEAGVPVVPVSGLTGMADGALTRPGEVAISLERMNRVEGIDPDQGTMALEAGVTLQAAQEAAAAQGLLLANDLGARGSALVGGVLATNAGGLKAVRYGVARDQVLGLEAVLADGRVVDSMTSTVKNNTGLDLKHLFIGTEGTLGIITRAVLRLRPQMRAASSAMIGCQDFQAATRVLGFLQNRLEGALSSFEVMWDDFTAFITSPGKCRLPLERVWPVTVLVEAEYAEEEATERFQRAIEAAFEQGLMTDAVVASSEAQRRELWALRESNDYLEEFQPQFRYDVSVPLRHMPAYVAAVWDRLDSENAGGRRFTFGHAGDSNVHFVVVPGHAGFDHDRCDDIVYRPLRGFRGAVSAEHGVGLAKKSALSHSRSETEIAVMQAVKRALDPRCLLNPGKIFDMPPIQP